MLESLVGHGIFCQDKYYEIVGETGGDAYQAGGYEVFDVFDLSDYTFYQLERNSIVGTKVVNSWDCQGVFKLRRDLVRNDTGENIEQGATLHIRATEPFVEALGTNREHWTATLVPSEFEWGSS